MGGLNQVFACPGKTTEDATMDYPFRNEAHEFLERAQAELDSGNDIRLSYAALDLRKAMEALTYDRAQAYKEEIPPSEYEAWQPKKLLKYLLEIDPMADSESALRVTSVVDGKAEGPPQAFGRERVLDLHTLQNHYDALGSHLHVPIARQRHKAAPSPEQLRSRCQVIAATLKAALSSPVWNIRLGTFATLAECMCCAKVPVRKRLPAGADSLEAKCFECNATYTLTRVNGQGHFAPHQIELDCPTPGCSHTIVMWRHEFAEGGCWQCATCGGEFIIALGIRTEVAGRAKRTGWAWHAARAFLGRVPLRRRSPSAPPNRLGRR